jgi:signal transduction histidine kinase
VALASKGVVWLLARDLSELVPRVWWGFAEGRYPTGPVEARKHPLLEREWANIAKPKREYPRLTKPVPMAVYAAGEAGMPAFFEAGEGETGRWWVSAPISGADGRLAGVLDLLVEEPFLPDVHEVVTDLTRRLGRQVVAALARTHLERCEGLARRLNRVAAGKIRSYQLQSLWQELAEACREEMVAASCDLFLRYSGSIVLRATTRSGPDITKFNPLDLWIAECQGGEPVGTAISGKRPLIARNRPSIGSNSHISPPLAQLLSRPEGEDWLVVPLVAEAETQASSQSPQGLAHPPERPVPPRDAASREPASSCEGVLVLRGPFLRHPRASVVEKDWNSKPDQGDVDLGMGLGRVIQRVARVALVVEEQNLLINEMVHSLAHPLEGLRGLTEDLLRDLAASGAAGARDLAAGSSGVRDAFQLIEESRDQLGLLAKLGGPLILGPPENLDLRAMVRDCCRTWRSLAAGRNVRIYRDLEASMPTVPGYKRWLRQAISNVIHNAIKYSFSNREVSVSLRRGKESAFLTVTNYGVGIPREDVSKVFDLYFRSRVPDAKGQREGMGVGLAVADQAVRLHGGKITIKSQPREKREAADRTSEKSTIGPTAEDIVDVEHRTEVVLEISQERRGRV